MAPCDLLLGFAICSSVFAGMGFFMENLECTDVTADPIRATEYFQQCVGVNLFSLIYTGTVRRPTHIPKSYIYSDCSPCISTCICAFFVKLPWELLLKETIEIS